MNPGQSISSYSNVYAPEVYNGIPQAPDVVEAPFDYIYDVVLTANQSLVDQTVSVDVDSDFELRGVLLAVNTGTFSMRWSDGQGYYVQSQELLDGNFSALTPYPSFPSLVIVAGGRIGVDITDLSAAGNTIQIVFRGVKVYRPKSR